MAERRTLLQKAANRFFGMPAIAQLWAKRQWEGGESPDDGIEGIPFTPMEKPAAECRVSLITTGGVHLPDQEPFDMEEPDGDATYREIPRYAELERLVITHKYYDHRDADRDVNVVFPLGRFRDLEREGVIGSLAGTHYGLMGHVDGERLPELIRETAPELAARLRREGVDVAFLTPA